LSATRELRLASLVPFSLHAEVRLDILAACNRPGCILDGIAQSSAAMADLVCCCIFSEHLSELLVTVTVIS
jgi:hypothetical protein